MHHKTKKDIEQILKHEKRISDLFHKISVIKKNCKHLDYRVELTNSLRFDFMPRRLCLVCGVALLDITKDETKELWQDFFREYADSEKLIEKAMADGGYNVD